MSIIDGIHWYNNPEDCENEKFDLTYLSLGAGVQSTALFYMACHGYNGMPKIDYAVFADTGNEPEYLWPHLKRLIEIGEEFNIPVHVCSAGTDGKLIFYSLGYFSKGSLSSFLDNLKYVQSPFPRSRLHLRQEIFQFELYLFALLFHENIALRRQIVVGIV